jgi:nitrogen regulatory protein PII-like uncharacterized protein
MKPKVYISVGSAGTSLQAKAAETIFRSLEAAGLSPRQMEKNEWSSEQPLRAIKRVIDQCHGAVVIAFARYQFPSGIEREKNGAEKQLNDIRMTTVWNQIEAAMAYTRGLPLLVIGEQGLLDDGLLEGRYDWKVYWTDFTPEHLNSDAFIGYLESWKQLVIAHSREGPSSASGDIDLSKISITQLCGRLTVPQLWAALSAALAALVGVATIAYRAGAGQWPWQ